MPPMLPLDDEHNSSIGNPVQSSQSFTPADRAVVERTDDAYLFGSETCGVHPLTARLVRLVHPVSFNHVLGIALLGTDVEMVRAHAGGVITGMQDVQWWLRQPAPGQQPGQPMCQIMLAPLVRSSGAVAVLVEAANPYPTGVCLLNTAPEGHFQALWSLLMGGHRTEYTGAFRSSSFIRGG